jgi:hypothetical protein
MGAETETRHVEDQDKKQANSQPEKREIVIVRYDKSLNEAVTGNKRGYRAEILHVAKDANIRSPPETCTRNSPDINKNPDIAPPQ